MFVYVCVCLCIHKDYLSMPVSLLRNIQTDYLSILNALQAGPIIVSRQDTQILAAFTPATLEARAARAAR